VNRLRLVVVVLLIAVAGGGAIALAASRTSSSSPARRESPSSTRPAAAGTTATAATTTTVTPPTTTTATTTVAATTPTTSAARIAIPTTPPTTPITQGATITAPVATPAAPGSLASVRGKTIAIDPGHNGGNGAHASEISRPIFIGTQTRACDTTGTQTNDGYTESAYNLDVALRLRDILQAAGAHVVMSRDTNDGWGPCIDERAGFANRAHADVAISIHADGGPASGRGFHVNMPALLSGYTDDIYSRSHQLGVDVRDTFTATGMPTSTYFGSVGLVERSDLGGLNLSDVPKVLVESGNMRNATDAALLESADFRQNAARALASGLARYLANP
jgi:N-acetylmuramoyl-L-alanine amidase